MKEVEEPVMEKLKNGKLCGAFYNGQIFITQENRKWKGDELKKKYSTNNMFIVENEKELLHQLRREQERIEAGMA